MNQSNITRSTYISEKIKLQTHSYQLDIDQVTFKPCINENDFRIKENKRACASDNLNISANQTPLMSDVT